MKEILQSLFDRLGPLSPGRLAAATTDELRAFLESRPRPDGRWDLHLEVAPNQSRAWEEGMDDREIVLRGDKSFEGVRTGPGRFLFARVPAGEFRLVAGFTMVERLRDVAKLLTERLLSAQQRMATVPGFNSGQTNTLAEHGIQWLVEERNGLVDVILQTTNPKFEGRRLYIRHADASAGPTMTFRRLARGIFEASAVGLPPAQFSVEGESDDAAPDDSAVGSA